MKTARYWLRERIRIQKEHIEFLEWQVSLERDLRIRWQKLYEEKDK